MERPHTQAQHQGDVPIIGVHPIVAGLEGISHAYLGPLLSDSGYVEGHFALAVQYPHTLIEFARQHNVQFEDVEFMTGGEFKEFAQRLFGNRFTTWGCHTDYATYGIIARSRG